MPTRKRNHDELEVSEPSTCPPMLRRLRNMWEFANLMQYIFIFGDAVRIDKDFDIEDLEAECLNHGSSPKLAEIGLCLLKNVSSHRGLTSENFDEYTRRQYQAKKPLQNPFGDEELPKSFQDFDVIQKIRVLVDLSQWTLINANSIKEKLEISEKDQASDWRIEPCGWDQDDRTYFVLDDNRLYRRTDPPINIPDPPKAKTPSKSGNSRNPKLKRKSRPPPTRGTRASKRLKLDQLDESQESQDDEEVEEGSDTNVEHEVTNGEHLVDVEDTFGGMMWECIAVTLEEYQEFLSKIIKSRDPNEKALYKFITAHVIPIIEAAEERRKQKALRQQRELDALQKLATAKRSSRIADRRQHEIEEAEARAVEDKRQRDLLEAQAMLIREQQMEHDRESRRITREQRIKERELRRVLEEEALNNLTAAEAQSDHNDSDGRMSKRQLKNKIERKRKVVEELQHEEEWVFDCSGCGVHGANIDDGSHSVACDSCNVWQHSACLGISETAADKEDFHFVCKDCQLKKEESKRQKPPPIKLKLKQSSSSPLSAKRAKKEHHVNGSFTFSTDSSRNAHSSNGAQWHNIFGKSPPPAFGAPASSFVAFDPSKYYIRIDVPQKTSNTTNAAGFSLGNMPRQAGQPPIGRFVSHSSKPITSSMAKQIPTPKNLTNGNSVEPLRNETTINVAVTKPILGKPSQSNGTDVTKPDGSMSIETAVSGSKAQNMNSSVDALAPQSIDNNPLPQHSVITATNLEMAPNTSYPSAISNNTPVANGSSIASTQS